MIKKRLLIVGAGGHGRVVAEAATGNGQWHEILFVDDKFPELTRINHWPVIGKITDLKNIFEKGLHLIVAIGENTMRLRLQETGKGIGYEIGVVIHPTAQLSDNSMIGEGSVVLANCIVNTGTSIGRGVILNSASTVDHDNLIGDGVHLSPGVHLGGNVSIGSLSWIGIAATVVHGCTIGENVVAGAGAVVIDNVSDATTVVGVPAKPIRS